MEERIKKLLEEGHSISDALKLASEQHYNEEKERLTTELEQLEEKQKDTTKAISDFLNNIGLSENTSKKEDIKEEKQEEPAVVKEEVIEDEQKDINEDLIQSEPVIEKETVLDDMQSQIYSVDQLVTRIKELNPEANIEYNNKVFEPGIIIEIDVNNLKLPDNFYYDSNLGITNEKNNGYPISLKVETKEKENKNDELEAMDKDLKDSIDRFNSLKAETYNFELPSADELEKSQEVNEVKNNVAAESDTSQMPVAEEVKSEETKEETQPVEKVEETAEEKQNISFKNEIINKISRESRFKKESRKVEKVQNAVLNPELTAILESGAVATEGARASLKNDTVPELLDTAGLAEGINNLSTKLNANININGNTVEKIENSIETTPNLLRAYAAKARGEVTEEKKDVEPPVAENVENINDATFTDNIENQLNEELEQTTLGGR